MKSTSKKTVKKSPSKKTFRKPIILVTNDDGITAPGLRNLAEVMKKFAEVIVVAPDSPQSAMGHAITINKPLRLDKVNVFDGIESWQCSGTPVDCVKLAVNKILKRKPDFGLLGLDWCIQKAQQRAN